MKIIILTLTAVLSFSVHSAALVHTTLTRIDVSGVVGEKGTLKALPYQLVAEFIDKTTTFPNNFQILGNLEASVGNSNLKINRVNYLGLSNVSLDGIQLSYIKNWSSDSFITIKIPFGEYHSCQNHDNGSSYNGQQTKVLTFKISGEFINGKIINACTH